MPSEAGTGKTSPIFLLWHLYDLRAIKLDPKVAECEGRKQLPEAFVLHNLRMPDADWKRARSTSKSLLTPLPSQQPSVTLYQFMRCGYKVLRPGNELGKTHSAHLEEFLKVRAVLRTSCVNQLTWSLENTVSPRQWGNKIYPEC